MLTFFCEQRDVYCSHPYYFSLCSSSRQLSITGCILAGQRTRRDPYPFFLTAASGPNPCPTYFSTPWTSPIKASFSEAHLNLFEGVVLLRSDIFPFCRWGFTSALCCEINPSSYWGRSSFVLVGKELLMMKLVSICVLYERGPAEHLGHSTVCYLLLSRQPAAKFYFIKEEYCQSWGSALQFCRVWRLKW